MFFSDRGVGVGEELSVDHVGEPSFQTAAGLFAGLGLLQLAQV